MKKHSRKWLIITLITASFAIITYPFFLLLFEQKNNILQKDFLIFGTLVQIKIDADNFLHDGAILQEIEEQYQAFQHHWHTWQKGGLLDQTNQAIADQMPVKINDMLSKLLKKAVLYEQQTQGLFNPAVGRIIALWGFHQNNTKQLPNTPKKEDIQAILKTQPSLSQIAIGESRWLTSTNPSIKIDLGAIAKGYIADWTGDFLKNHGVQNALINVGGDILAIGQKNNLPWRVAIQDPRKPNKLIAELDMVQHPAVATSGNYNRFYDIDGVRYGHIIDPRTGRPANKTQSVTVFAKTATQADAFATALFVGGPEYIAKLAKQSNIQVLLIDIDGRQHMTPMLKNQLLNN